MCFYHTVMNELSWHEMKWMTKSSPKTQLSIQRYYSTIHYSCWRRRIMRSCPFHWRTWCIHDRNATHVTVFIFGNWTNRRVTCSIFYALIAPKFKYLHGMHSALDIVWKQKAHSIHRSWTLFSEQEVSTGTQSKPIKCMILYKVCVCVCATYFDVVIFRSPRGFFI